MVSPIFNPMILSSRGINATTWDPLNKGASVSLSNANLTGTWANGANPSVRVVVGLTTGKIYWEETPSTITTASWIGFVNGSFVITGTDVLVGVANCWSYRNNGDIVSNGSVITSLATYAAGAVIMQALDIAGGKWWAGSNGTWLNSGDPGAGTGALVTTGITGTLYAAAAMNAAASVVTGNFGGSPLAFPVPSGFTRGWGS